MTTLRLAKIRAILGIVFALLGIAVGVGLFFRPGPKLMGLAFAAVLVGLGVVRVRMYLKIKNELAP
jgi:hypothetical protein